LIVLFAPFLVPPLHSILKMSNILKVVSDLKAQIATLETMLVTATSIKKRGRPSKASLVAVAITEPKPKREISTGMKAWHDFNTRIDQLLKTNNTPFKRVAEAKQFASKLKKEMAVTEWTDEKILSAREAWAEEHKPLCPVCKESVTDDATSHRDCLRSFAESYVTDGKGTVEEAIADWTKISGAGVPIVEEPVGEKKKPGRPKMTDEQKASAKAKRDMVTVINETQVVPSSPPKNISKSALPPGAPKKETSQKEAWAINVNIRSLEGDLESVVSVDT